MTDGSRAAGGSARNSASAVVRSTPMRGITDACLLPSTPIDFPHAAHLASSRLQQHAGSALMDPPTSHGQLADDVDAPSAFKPIACVDASELSKQLPGWSFE